nr:hypothetical protein [Acidobacteriota bacterium]
MSLHQLAKALFTILTVMMVSGVIGTDSVWAQAETLPKGRGIFSVFYTRSDTEKRFDFLGDRVR